MELVKDNGAELVNALLDAVYPEELLTHALEFRGIHVGLLPKTISTSVLCEVGEHEVHLQHEWFLLLPVFLRGELQAELGNVVEFDLLLAVPNEETASRKSALLLDDVGRDKMVVVRAGWLALWLLDLHWASQVAIRDSQLPMFSFPIDTRLQVVQPLVE
jgi:hypothetical protein